MEPENVCTHCEGSGWDSYPNHSTTYPICTWCEGTGKEPDNKYQEFIDNAVKLTESELTNAINVLQKKISKK